MLKRLLKSLVLAITATVLFYGVVLAAWEYKFPINISDTSNTTRTYYPVMMGFGGQTLIDAGKIATNGTGTNMMVGATNIKYMMATGSVTAVIPNLPSGGVAVVDLYTGYSPEQSVFAIVVGSGGYVTVSDNASLEPSANFSMVANGYLDADTTGDIVGKTGAYVVDVTSAGYVTVRIVGGSSATWTSQTSAADEVWYDIAWSPELRLFAAVNPSAPIGSRVMTSPNGINWTVRAGTTNTAPFAIAWSPTLGVFVTVGGDVGGNNKVMVSSDGINWVGYSSGINNDWLDVAWSPDLGLFAAVSYNGTGNRVMTSVNGTGWVSQVSAADNAWRGITWSPELGLFVAVSENGTGNRVMTSPNGVNWTSQTSASDNDWRRVAWSPSLGLFAAVSENGTGNRVMTSVNGTGWVSQVSAADNAWRGITWSPELGLFVAVSQNGTGNRVMVSIDGVNWVSQTSAADTQWQDVDWSPELRLFAAVSASGFGNRVMTSPASLVATGAIMDGVYKVEAYADSANLTLKLNDVVAQSVALGGSAAGNTTSNWILMSNAIPYADNITLYVGGTPQLYFAPNVMISGTNLPDRSLNSHNGTITWGSNSGITIAYGEMISFESFSATDNITGFDLSEASIPSSWYASGSLSGLPFYDSFSEVAAQTGQPVQQLYALGIIGLAFGTFLGLIVFTRSALLGYIAMVMVFGIGASMMVIPAWIVFTLIIVGAGIMYLYRQVAY